jgi:hypothetical protein
MPTKPGINVLPCPSTIDHASPRYAESLGPEMAERTVSEVPTESQTGIGEVVNALTDGHG